MRRRDFITLTGGGVAWPLVARAQPSGKIWRIGFIAHTYETFYDPLFQGLRELGYTEGHNLIVERRYAEGHVERFQEFAAELVRLKVDVIIVVTTPAALRRKERDHDHPDRPSGRYRSGRDRAHCQPGTPRRQYYGTCGSQCRNKRKASGVTPGSGAQAVARCGSLECRQPR
jgi:hypothetical protein